MACFDWFLSLLLYKENEIKEICMLSRPSDDCRVTEHYLAPFPSEIPNPNKLVVFFFCKQRTKFLPTVVSMKWIGSYNVVFVLLSLRKMLYSIKLLFNLQILKF